MDITLGEALCIVIVVNVGIIDISSFVSSVTSKSNYARRNKIQCVNSHQKPNLSYKQVTKRRLFYKLNVGIGEMAFFECPKYSLNWLVNSLGRKRV